MLSVGKQVLIMTIIILLGTGYLIFVSTPPVEIVVEEPIEYNCPVNDAPFVEIVDRSLVRQEEQCNLSDSQLLAVRFSYEQGRPYDFGHTLAAIAIQESNAGKWKMNISDPSGGLYHVTLDKVINHFGWEDTSFNRNRAMQALVDDDHLAAELAIKELEFWREYNSGIWLDIWASYNAGTNGPNTERGQAYADDIRITIRQMEYCGWVL